MRHVKDPFRGRAHAAVCKSIARFSLNSTWGSESSPLPRQGLDTDNRTSLVFFPFAAALVHMCATFSGS